MIASLLLGASVLLTGCDESAESGEVGGPQDSGSGSAAAEPVTQQPDASTTVADGAVARDAGTPDASTSSVGAADDCAASCAPAAAAGCEFFSLSGCMAACNTQKVKGGGHCDAEFTSYHSCHAKASFRCVQGGPKTDTCVAELGSLDQCLSAHPLTCTAPAGASSCDLCLAKKCCSEREACDADCHAYENCEKSCQTQTCVDACLAQHPAAERPYFWYKLCKQDDCTSECR
jgi:hypothetical protein